MSKILKFPKRHKSYSDNFLKNVKPDAIGDLIYSTYLSLVFEEEGEQPVPFDDIEHYIWAAHDKKTLH
jgi:hypothetical protein